MEKERRVNTHESNQQYLEAILIVQNLCSLYSLDHRFVGGTLTDLLSPRTKATFDFDERRVYLRDYNRPQMFRSDGTVKDMDLISFQQDPKRFSNGKEGLGKKEQGIKKQGLPFPHISIEPIRTPLNPRNGVLQFVSGFETDGNDLFLTFDHIRQKIDPKTVEPWRIVLADDFGVSLVALNPYAYALRYLMRVPSSMKGKDKELKRENGQTYNKMSPYVNLALLFAEQAQFNYELGIDGLYAPWIDFIKRMRYDSSLGVKTKRAVTGTYWDTVGTAVAHGRGIFGFLANFGDRFSG